jgi:hypothetical protein
MQEVRRMTVPVQRNAPGVLAPQGASGSAFDPEAVPRFNQKLAFGGFGAVVLGVIVFPVGALWFPEPALNLAVLLWIIGGVFGVSSVLIGASPKTQWVQTGYKVSAALTFLTPILITFLIGYLHAEMSSETRLSWIVGMSTLVAAVIAGFLKSDVSGVRRDALELSLILVGIVAAFATAVGVLQLG